MKHKKGSLRRDVLINLSSDMLIQQLTVPYGDKLFQVNDAFEYSTEFEDQNVQERDSYLVCSIKRDNIVLKDSRKTGKDNYLANIV